LKEPHVPAGAQLQVTPALAESFVTLAAIEAVPLAAMDDGGAVEMDTETAAGRPFTATVALALLVLSATEVAVMVTLPLAGTDEGAV
jgi:hypothetical protein